ncbi:protein argonaute 5-like isoform X1 [Euphorbia lathyris]|uniref:protein argonaute 5-like isoform X1 n=1 Tax=Euphorbia lathyris TaxID=212925 RepID=UPI003313B330
MSRRAGSGGGRRQDSRCEQQQPTPSFQRGGGRGRGGPVPQTTSSASAVPPPHQAVSSFSSAVRPDPAEASSSAAAVEKVRRQVEQKLAIGEPAVKAPAPPASSKSVRFPSRPGFGTLGKKCLLKANHFLVEISERDFRQYDVTITPEVLSKAINRQVISQLITQYRQSHLGNRMPAYDGRKSLYTAGPLPFQSKEFVVKLPEKDQTAGSSGSAKKDRDFKVAIKFASMVDQHRLREFLSGKQIDSPQEAIQALDIVLRAGPSKDYTIVGRSFFSLKLGDPGELGDGVEYWRGYYQSLRPTQMGLSLNVDVSARSFYVPIPVIDFVSKNFRLRDMNRPVSDQDRVKLKKALRGLRVELSHQDHVKTYKITGLSSQPLNQTFFNQDGSSAKISVVQYFRERYNIGLRYTALPGLQAGNDSRPIYLPMELCKIVEGQRYTKKLNGRQVNSLLKATCERPFEREANIKKMVEANKFRKEELVNDEFGIRVKEELTFVEARVLPPPMLNYHATGGEARVNPSLGQWNMINKKMVNGGRVDFWTCVNFSSQINRDLPKEFCRQLIQMCVSKGMEFNTNALIPIRAAHPSQIEKTLVDIHMECEAKLANQEKARLQLLIIILPDFTGSYGTIKRICETELGIVSQCCQPKQALRLDKQYFENIALKINVKVGGRNSVLSDAIQRRIPLVSDRPTIILGADVTHPSPGEDSSPSIAAVVASMDWPEITKYRGIVSAQTHREEIIQDLYKTYQDKARGLVHSGMIRELFIEFRKSTGQKPHRVIIYRDGVSEGQFNQVLLYEMDAIRKACASLEQGYCPPVTFVVVQKRHHTRFFPAERSGADKNGNILPGTVVDTKICHQREFDFYLNSHASIKGTSRPSHYHVLFDENNFSADVLQMVTNSLCYTYARCTRSVSIVPPAYYAHLAAFRARYYIEGETSDEISSGGPAAGGAGRNRVIRPLPAIKDNVKDVMFYC